LPPGSNNLDYITTAMPAADAVNWFGKVPPDLSLIARSKGVDYIYRFLKTFYVDQAAPPAATTWPIRIPRCRPCSPSLERREEAVFRQVGDEKVFDHFQARVPGSITVAQYDDFVRDTVNFLDYAGEPAQVERRSMGNLGGAVSMLLLTWLSWQLKKEYWKEVH
jgi:ubiquinol-cytochrome c reductase cytochrome c1 subunit